MINKIKEEILELKILLRSIPSLILTLFAVSVIAMNLLANKSISLNVDWLALDCGIVFSWLAFLTMDIITKHYGPAAATKISVIVAVINLFFCLLFFLASLIPGIWGESYVEGSQNIINNALNNTFGGIWYVLLGSSIAFIISSFVNNFSNYALKSVFKKDDFKTFAFRSYISTALGQLADNLIFALLVSHFFFGWTLLQCFTCAVTGMLVELLCEVIFSRVGYQVCKDWKKNNIGNDYFKYLEGKKA